MTDYGQLIPNRVVHITSVLNTTKAGFSHLLAKALVKVGMKFIGSWSTYDILDPANAEFGTPNQTNQNRNFFFDFPTSEVFYLGGLPYRPCIAIHAHTSDTLANMNSTTWCTGFGIKLGRRRADRLLLSDFRSSEYYRLSETTNFSNWDVSTATNAFRMGQTMRQKEGLVYETTAPFWKPFASSARTPNTEVTTRNFGNVYVYLGKGGLFVFVGSGQGTSEFGSRMSAGMDFAGGRIPGRGRIPAQDVNLDRIMPVFDLPMLTVSTDFFNSTSLVNSMLGIQHDLKVRADYPCYVLGYNLENVEQPLYPSYVVPVLRSPRVVNGQGSYVLSRLVIVPQYLWTDSADFVGPVDSQITGSAVRPQWADVFTAQNFRLADRTVGSPVEYVDPVTLKPWFIIRAENTNMSYAIDYTGKVIYNDANLTQTLIQTINVDFSVGGFAGPFPAGVEVTTSSVISGAGPGWTPVSGQNEARILAVLSSTRRYLHILYTPQPGEEDMIFTISWESKIPATVLGNASITLFGEYLRQDGTVLVGSTQAITTVPANPQYNYQAFTSPYLMVASTGKLTFQMDYNNPGFSENATPSVRNIVIRKYRYAPA